MQDRENADCRRNVGKTEKMRSRRRKRRGSGLWPGAVAVLAAGMVFAARTEILDLAKTGVDLVVDDDHQENSAEKPDLSVTENSDAAADGEETLTDAGANSTDETGADRKYMDADSEISADGSGEQEFIELPSSYDLRERRAIRVFDQGDLGTCWAFAALKAVETSMPESMAVPLSADHMSIHNSFGISQNSGGDYSMAMAYLLAWQGPVSEADDPYGDSTSPDGLAPVCHVQEIRILQAKDYDAVKRAVFLYGGVQTSLYLPAENRGGDGNVCYKGSEEPNHDTVIIGWDDDYPKEKFASAPESDGAFLCINSWGETFGDGGFFHVSYEDSRIAESSISYRGIELSDNYDRNYQSDLCGWTGQMGYGEPDTWMANVYTAESEETLEAVGFYATAPDTEYEVYVFDGDSFREHVENGVKFQVDSGKVLASGMVTDAGFYTVRLAKPQTVNVGEPFAVAVKIHTPGTTQPVAVEYAGGGRTGNIDIGDGEGYISFDGSLWERTETSKRCNVCLKAYSRKIGK